MRTDRQHAAWRRLLTQLLAVTLVLGGIALAERTAGAEDPPPVVTNPTTSTKDASVCGRTCGDSDIMNPTVQPSAADRPAVDALETRAIEQYATLHDLDPLDPRIRRWGQNDVRALMLTQLMGAISLPAAGRTPEESHLVSWFGDVVREYQRLSVQFAKQEFENWKALGCNFVPAAPTPAYEPGTGCDQINDNGLSDNLLLLATGARQPRLDRFLEWGTYEAAQTLGRAQEHLDIDDAQDSLAATLGLSAAVGGGAAAGGIFGAVTDGVLGPGSRAFGAAANKISTRIISRAANVASRAMSTLGGTVILAVAALMVVLAIVAIVLTVVNAAIDASLPEELNKAAAAAEAVPDLTAMLQRSDGNGGLLLTTLFLGQTRVNGSRAFPNTPQAGPPTWHGDLIDTDPVGPGATTTSKALALRTWGTTADEDDDEAVTVLSDMGMLQLSHDGGSTWITDAKLDYIGWDGKPHRALRHGDRFLDLEVDGANEAVESGTDCATTGTCSERSSLQALDANGQEVTVSIRPERAVEATIQTTGGFVQGQPTTFTNPNVSANGTPVTYRWQIESRRKQPSLVQYVITGGFDDDGNFTDVDTAFDGNPPDTYLGQSIQHTWPAAGTYHVRLTTTDAHGLVRVQDTDVTVTSGGPPSIELTESNLGFLRVNADPEQQGSSTIGRIAGCLHTATGAYALQELTVDWGDGSVESAQPSLHLLGAPAAPTLSILDGGQPGCDAARSFVATHRYPAGVTASSTYNVTLTLDDGEGRTTQLHANEAPEDDRLQVRFSPAELDWSQFGFLTAPRSQQVHTGPGGALEALDEYDAGEETELLLRFTAPPQSYGDRVYVDWGDGTTPTELPICDRCGTDDPYTLTHTFRAKPGSGGGAGVYTVTANVADGDDVQYSFARRVLIAPIAPTVELDLPATTTVTQGTRRTIVGRVQSPDPTTPIVLTFAWEFGAPATETITLPPATGWQQFSIPHVFRRSGTTPVQVTATDHAGATGSAYAAFSVANVAPKPRVFDSVRAVQGTPVQFDVNPLDPGLGTHTYRVTTDWGDGTPPVVRDFGSFDGTLELPTFPHTYRTGQAIAFIKVKVEDLSGGVGETIVFAQIANRAPVLGLDDGSGTAGTPTTLTGTIDEVGADESFTGTVDWRDGTAPEAFTKPAGTTTFSLQHTFTTGGVYPAQVTVTDSRGGTSNEAIGTLSVTGKPSFRANQPPTGRLGTSSAYLFTAQGFPAPTFALASGTLPPGLELAADGTLQGTPTAAGRYEFGVRATNSVGSQVTSGIGMDIEAPPAFGTVAPPAATADAAYAGYQVPVTGFPIPTVTLASGSLPSGMTITSSGQLQGTPDDPGTFTFRLTASNSVTSVTSGDITLVVGGIVPVLGPTTPPAGYRGLAYSYAFSASGKPTPTFTVASGALPAGLSLSAAGLLSGTPTVTGTSTFTVRATNSRGQATSSAVTVRVTAPVKPTLTTRRPGAGTVGEAYRFAFAGTGSPAPTFAVTSGALPPGLVLDSVTGVIAGTPTTAGSYAFRITASSPAGTASVSATVVVARRTAVTVAVTRTVTVTCRLLRLSC